MTMDWDQAETERACIALNLLNGEIDMREAMRRMEDTGIDEDAAREFLNAAAVERIG